MGHKEYSHEKVSQSLILLRTQVHAHTYTHAHMDTYFYLLLMLLSVQCQETSAKLSDHHTQEFACCDLSVLDIFVLYFMMFKNT